MLLMILWVVCPAALAGGKMEVLYSWSQVDFTFPSNSLRDFYIASGKFIPKNNLILDVDVWGGSGKDIRKLFVTMPKFKPGTPVTLATVTDYRRNGTTLLRPYPDWTWHDGSLGCDGMTTVFRTKVDTCGRLWVLDTGSVDIFVKTKKMCPPQILVFDLFTDTLIRRHRFPDSILDYDSLLITITVDSRTRDCHDAMAYVADVGSYKLLVYDFAEDHSWSIKNNLFYPHPLHGEFHINGVEFDLMDGIFGLALGPIRSDGDRTLYFHSLAGVHEGWVSTSVVRNRSLFADNENAKPRSFHYFKDKRDSQAAAQDMTHSGILFYGLVEENAIGCWNSHRDFNKQNLGIAAKDDVNLQFQSGLKVYGNHLWALSSRLQNYFEDEVPQNEVNYRILVARVSDVVRNTRCEVRHRHEVSPAYTGDLNFPSSEEASSFP